LSALAIAVALALPLALELGTDASSSPARPSACVVQGLVLGSSAAGRRGPCAGISLASPRLLQDRINNHLQVVLFSLAAGKGSIPTMTASG